MLCAMAAALGAACNTAQEAQSLAIVLLSPVIVPLCIMMPIMQQPNGVLATAISLFPPFTPLLKCLAPPESYGARMVRIIGCPDFSETLLETHLNI